MLSTIKEESAINCINCLYRKSIKVFTKCAGVPGRNQAGISYYCSHPENCNPVPVISSDTTVLDSCPVCNGTN